MFKPLFTHRGDRALMFHPFIQQHYPALFLAERKRRQRRRIIAVAIVLTIAGGLVWLSV